MNEIVAIIYPKFWQAERIALLLLQAFSIIKSGGDQIG